MPYRKSIFYSPSLLHAQHVTLNIGIYERLYFGDGKTSLPTFCLIGRFQEGCHLLLGSKHPSAIGCGPAISPLPFPKCCWPKNDKEDHLKTNPFNFCDCKHHHFPRPLAHFPLSSASLPSITTKYPLNCNAVQSFSEQMTYLRWKGPLSKSCNSSEQCGLSRVRGPIVTAARFPIGVESVYKSLPPKLFPPPYSSSTP